jgi:outer membrane protein OmpA-like peptidoglycan-associated protein
MLVAGPQRGLFLGFLSLGVACLLALDLHFAPALMAEMEREERAATDAAPAASAVVAAAASVSAEPVVRVVVDPAARVPTIVARFDRDAKEPADESAIRALAAAMIEDHEVKIVLEGHSDQFGPDAVNHEISLKRAEWVKERLVQLGVSPERIETAGLGATRPLRHDEPDAESVNRRVEVRWVGR